MINQEFVTGLPNNGDVTAMKQLVHCNLASSPLVFSEQRDNAVVVVVVSRFGLVSNRDLGVPDPASSLVEVCILHSVLQLCVVCFSLS